MEENLDFLNDGAMGEHSTVADIVLGVNMNTPYPDMNPVSVTQLPPKDLINMKKIITGERCSDIRDTKYYWKDIYEVKQFVKTIDDEFEQRRKASPHKSIEGKYFVLDCPRDEVNKFRDIYAFQVDKTYIPQDQFRKWEYQYNGFSPKFTSDFIDDFGGYVEAKGILISRYCYSVPNAGGSFDSINQFSTGPEKNHQLSWTRFFGVSKKGKVFTTRVSNIYSFMEDPHYGFERVFAEEISEDRYKAFLQIYSEQIPKTLNQQT